MARITRALANLWPKRRVPPPASPEPKGSATGPLIAWEPLGRPVWAPRDYAHLAREGFMQNAIVYRSVRMIAEAAATVPLLLYDGDHEIEAHPLIDLLRQPSLDHTSADFFESWYGFLLVSGNAYCEAVGVGGRLRELHVLRPDRMKVIPGADGWPEGFEYTAGGQSVRLGEEAASGVRGVLHVKLFHPANDHYGMSPLGAAAAAIDIHNTASGWNKALLDNAARPSGALVYQARDQHMTGEQFERLKAELEAGFQGAKNAGRPLLLEGGLDWKALSLSPKDMDFIEAKNAAAREIALAIGVPPMLLGIPGDNTYSNYQEATRVFWRATVLPLVERTAKAFAAWLSPAWGSPLSLKPDIDAIEALSGEREALWKRLEGASFLTIDEKRAAIGYGPMEGGAQAKYNADQPRVPAGTSGGGQWTDGGGGGEPVREANLGRAISRLVGRLKQPKPRDQPLQDILKPGGKERGWREKGAGDDIRTVEPDEFEQLKKSLLDGAKEIEAPVGYAGKWYERLDGTIVGERQDTGSTPAVEVIRGGKSGLENGYKVHKK